MLKFIKIFPKKFLSKLVYSKAGQQLIKILKKKQVDSGSYYNIDYGLKMHLDFTNLHELKMMLGDDPEKKIKNIICEIHHEILKKKGVDENKIYSLLMENSFSVSHISGRGKLSHILAQNLRN